MPVIESRACSSSRMLTITAAVSHRANSGNVPATTGRGAHPGNCRSRAGAHRRRAGVADGRGQRAARSRREPQAARRREADIPRGRRGVFPDVDGWCAVERPTRRRRWRFFFFFFFFPGIVHRVLARIGDLPQTPMEAVRTRLPATCDAARAPSRRGAAARRRHPARPARRVPRRRRRRARRAPGARGQRGGVAGDAQALGRGDARDGAQADPAAGEVRGRGDRLGRVEDKLKKNQLSPTRRRAPRSCGRSRTPATTG